MDKKYSAFCSTGGYENWWLCQFPKCGELVLFPSSFDDISKIFHRFIPIFVKKLNFLIIFQIWAVLTKRQEMALLMWAHGEESLAKSLVACKLYKAMAHEAAEDDLDTEIYDELKAYAKDFESKGIKLLDFCYRQDAERAQRLLTCELQSWSSQSCLSLAVAANHRPLLAHPCSQVILADLWMGGLR